MWECVRTYDAVAPGRQKRASEAQELVVTPGPQELNSVLCKGSRDPDH